jgi:hypothetical protein
MTAPERRRPLPALAVIAALCLLTALVWFRVLHRDTGTGDAAPSKCPSPSTGRPSAAPSLRANELPRPGKVAVLVLNSTQRNGLATLTEKALQAVGFDVTKAADDAKAYGGHGLIKGVAEIRYGPNGRAGARLLRYYFPTATMRPNHSRTALVTVSLGARFSKPASPATVRKAVAKAHLTIAGTPTPTPSSGASHSC